MGANTGGLYLFDRLSLQYLRLMGNKVRDCRGAVLFWSEEIMHCHWLCPIGRPLWAFNQGDCKKKCMEHRVDRALICETKSPGQIFFSAENIPACDYPCGCCVIIQQYCEFPPPYPLILKQSLEFPPTLIPRHNPPGRPQVINPWGNVIHHLHWFQTP